MQSKSAYLVLESGKVFCGQSFGSDADAVGEIEMCIRDSVYSVVIPVVMVIFATSRYPSVQNG